MKIRKTIVPLAAVIRPQQLGSEDVAKSGWFDVSQVDAVSAVLQAGALDGAEVVFSFEKAKAGADGNADNDTSAAIEDWNGATLTVDGSSAQVDNETGTLGDDFKFVRLVATSDDGGEPTVSASMLGYSPRYTDDYTAAGADTVGTGPAP